MTYVFDASALLRLLFNQVGEERIRQIIDARGTVRILMCAVNWGEVIVQLDRYKGRELALGASAMLLDYGLEVIPVTTDRAERTALLKRDWKLSYADAFCAQLATEHPGAILVTGDFGFRAVNSFLPIEFLPDELGRTSLQ